MRHGVIIDFGGRLKYWKDVALAYRDLSPTGDSSMAAANVFDTLRWSETVDGAQRVYFPEIVAVDAVEQIGSNSSSDGEDVTNDALILAERYRTGQQICPKGSYCKKGRQHLCPAGTFGNRTKLLHTLCSGFCPAGYFCKVGSAEPQECDLNTYSTPGNSLCIPCNNPHPEGYKRCKTSRLCCSQ